MATSWLDVFQSKIVTFVVGEDKKEFQLHASAIAKLSQPLDVLLNGQMKEAREGRVEWPDIDEQTFVRFLQWVYSKTYDVPEPDGPLTAAATSKNDPKTCKAPQADIQGLKMPTATPVVSTVAPVGSTVANCVECFSKKPSDLGTSATCAKIKRFLEIGRTTTFIPRSNTKCTEDYTNIFLCHAELYILGDKYLLTELKQLAFDRLHATLKAFTFYRSHPLGIIALTKRVFENTQSEDKIRTMITLYFGFLLKELSRCVGMRELLEDVPDLAVALVMQIMNFELLSFLHIAWKLVARGYGIAV
ncbi:hypothetical protein N0V82_005971 [Gnomoniopsis sp. IMI 355080]|nr:hypothetical protein N0V82_005971 [Gnomoniopsis sp. IMI 355080]